MLKTLLRQIGKYRRDTLLAPLFTALDVVMEVLIPFITASLIEYGIEVRDFRTVLRYSGLMLLMAFCSLASGILAGACAAKASSGFACNLRDTIYEKIQDC